MNTSHSLKVLTNFYFILKSHNNKNLNTDKQNRISLKSYYNIQNRIISFEPYYSILLTLRENHYDT